MSSFIQGGKCLNSEHIRGLNVYKKRAERIRKYLAEMDLSALVVFDSLNTVYVSGFQLDVEPWERPVATVIPLEAEPFMILNELSINHYRYGLENNEHWIKDVIYYDEHPRLTKRHYYTQDFPRLLCETLEERGIFKGCIGVDNSDSTLEKWVGYYLHDLKVVDASKLLREMRLVKDEYELDLMRKAAELTDYGLEKMKEAIKVGKSNLEVGHEVAYEIAKEAAKKYPVDVSIEISAGFTGTGPEGAMPHGWRMPNGRKIEKGDTLLAVVGVRLNKYWVEDERTFIVGKPSEKQKRFFDVVTEGQRKAIEMCVAGNKVSDIDAAALKVIEDAGFGDYVFHRTGHGMGLGGHEYWHDMAFNNKIMQPGMVTSVEPMLCVYGLGGFRHSDTIVIGKYEPEVLTKYTKELENLIISA
jgi:Xaa-Pro aminopeptidase